MATDGESPTLEPFYSKTGVYLTFDNILSTGWYDGFLDEEFYFDFDSDGGYWSWVVWIENGMGHIFDDDNLVKNEKYHYSGLIYNPEASYYSLRFVTYRLTYNVSNITMSNF